MSQRRINLKTAGLLLRERMRVFLKTAGLLLLFSPAFPQEIPYSVPSEPWPESFGNHRAVLEAEQDTGMVLLDFLWRRHDTDPDKRRFIIVNASTGDTVSDIIRHEVNQERCSISFGPVKKGIYHFYYLPYLVQEGWGFYGRGYLKPVGQEGKRARGQEGKVKVVRIEARSAFDSFYPMEVAATVAEVNALVKNRKEPFLLFPEDRRFPIRMKDKLPLRWINEGPKYSFFAEAHPNEYFAFQIGLFASSQDVDQVSVTFNDLHSDSDAVIAANQLTCFNTGGIDPYGQPFEKEVNVCRGMVQALWIGVDIPEFLPAGTYQGYITITGEKIPGQNIKVQLTVGGEVMEDRGDAETWRHSRLRWLNSTAGLDDLSPPPYPQVEELGMLHFGILGRSVRFTYQSLPKEIFVGSENILSGRIHFEIDANEPGVESDNKRSISSNKPGQKPVKLDSYQEFNLYKRETSTTFESDGYILTKIMITPLRDFHWKDARLDIPMKAEYASYMMGMNLPGCETPGKHESKWGQKPEDSFWIGHADGGISVELRGASYTGPLLNLYRPAPPTSWNNEGKGGFRIERSGETVHAIIYTGEKDLKEGEPVEFEFAMLITPVKPLNSFSQFHDRYYHNGGSPEPPKDAFEAGVKIVNLHHANRYNPHINYPFIAVEEMREFVNEVHAREAKVKIYYTIRELTNYVTEIWALRSLGDEILGYGSGGGYPWLQEHFTGQYTPQWYQFFPDKSADASILTSTGASRWYNYYIEGLRWLVRNVDIDGLYLDDVAFDRNILKRMRKVMDEVKPGCLIDLHSNTGFSKGPAIQYTEYFPYVDKLWFGESFIYDTMSPAQWLVEVSGIPFGLMGDMLHGGGNRWLGMVFGMTARLPWSTEGVTCDPKLVWKIWDQFGIETSNMSGFWDRNPAIITNHPSVKATAYIKDGKTLIAIGNFSDDDQEIQLRIDWQQLQLDPLKVSIAAPEIVDFQTEKAFRLGEAVPVKARQGWLLVMTNDE